MKPWQMGAVLAVAGSALSAGAVRQAVPAQQEPVWLSDFSSGQAAAHQSGKPIFLVFR